MRIEKAATPSVPEATATRVALAKQVMAPNQNEISLTFPSTFGPNDPAQQTSTAGGGGQPAPSTTTTAAGDETVGTDGATIILQQPSGKEATLITKGVPYRMKVTTEGDFFVGSVQLTGGGQAVDLFEAPGCPTGATPGCSFADVAPDQSKGKRQQRTYTISLTAIPLESNLTEGQGYTLVVTWSREETPTEGSIETDSPMNRNNNRPEFILAPFGSPDVGPTNTASATSARPTAEQTAVDKDDKPITSGTTGIPSSVSPSVTGAPLSDPAASIGGGGGGLSTGAKAGIAVGAVFGVLAIIAFIFLCLRRRKSKRKTAGGYYGDAPGSANDLREKEAGVGIAAIPASGSPTSEGNGTSGADSALIGRGRSARVVDGSNLESGDRVGRHATTGHAPAALGAAGVARKPVGHRDEETVVDREGAQSSASHVLSEEERARWEEEERRLDEDIAEAERRRLA